MELTTVPTENLINELMARHPDGMIFCAVKKLTKRKKEIISDFTSQIEYSQIAKLINELQQEVDEHYGIYEEEQEE